MDRAHVRNAADGDQVRRADRRDRRRANDRHNLVGYVLSSYQGRAFVWDELSRHGLWESMTVQSSLIYALSGRRDAGLELLADVQEHPEAFLLMQNEAIARQKRDDAETDATHTARAGETNG